ncbi:MarR family transcriptional regulator [Streptomyces rimosus]|uniref:MarR family transcriptional regulator n=1 Tax=Streptomyces rimosus TaxID=1927 RepID=UPI0031E038CE
MPCAPTASPAISRPRLAAPGYGKRSAPDQNRRHRDDFTGLPEREAFIAAFIDRLPDGAAMDVKTLAATQPRYGQQAVRSALTHLSTVGHLRRVQETVGNGGTQWVYRTYFTRTARNDTWWHHFLTGNTPPQHPPDERPPTPAPTIPPPAVPDPECAPPDPDAPAPAAPDPASRAPAPPEPALPDPVALDPAALAPALPDPASPDPAAPDPALPDPATPEPAPPDPVIPALAPAAPDPAPLAPAIPEPSPRTATPVRTEATTNPHPAPPPHSPAYAALAALGTADPRMILSAAECSALEALAAQWLAQGVSPTHLITVLTAGLPPEVHSPGAIARTRLTTKLPPAPLSNPTPGQAPEHISTRVMECTECGVPGRPEALPGGLCRDCRGDTPPPDPTAARDHAQRTAHFAHLCRSRSRPGSTAASTQRVGSGSSPQTNPN